MNATIEETSVCGFAALTLANDLIHATIIPSLGARVWNLVDRSRGREWDLASPWRRASCDACRRRV